MSILRDQLLRSIRDRPEEIFAAGDGWHLTFSSLGELISPPRSSYLPATWGPQDVVHIASCLVFQRPFVIVDPSRRYVVDKVREDDDSIAYGTFQTGTVSDGRSIRWVTCRSVDLYVEGIVSALQVPEAASFASCTPLWFDLAYTALVGAIATGGTYFYIGPSHRLSPRKFARVLRSFRPHYWKVTPSLFYALALASSEYDEPFVDTLILGGEISTTGLVRRALESGFCRVACNHYGPAETTIGALMKTGITNVEDEWGEIVPIGQPLSGIECRLGSGERQTVKGQARPLFLGGPQVEANGDFVALEGGFYETKDLCLQLASGDIQFISRADRAVKVGGVSIDLFEVERVACENRSVTGCRASYRKAESGGQVVLTINYSEPTNLTERLRLRDSISETLHIPSSSLHLQEANSTRIQQSGKAW